MRKLYAYRCHECDDTFDSEHMHRALCPKCGAEARRIFGGYVAFHPSKEYELKRKPKGER